MTTRSDITSRRLVEGGGVCPECGGLLGREECTACHKPLADLQRTADAMPAPIGAPGIGRYDDSQFGGALEHHSRADSLIRSVLDERRAAGVI